MGDRWTRNLGMTVGVVLATRWLPVFVNLHSSSRGDTRTQLQAPRRKQHVAVELDPAKLFMEFSPFCWAGHKPFRGHHYSVPPSFRAGSEPQEKMGSF